MFGAEYLFYRRCFYEEFITMMRIRLVRRSQSRAIKIIVLNAILTSAPVNDPRRKIERVFVFLARRKPKRS